MHKHCTDSEQKIETLDVGFLLEDRVLEASGYLLLPFGVMQTAGSAAQTVAGIRSHWGRKTYADERTIAVAACLDERTVRRHLGRLAKMEFMSYRMIDSRKGKRREWYFTVGMRTVGKFWDAKAATLPRWAAVILPEWSYRAVYATVLQRSLATHRGSQCTTCPVSLDSVLAGDYGRHEFSLQHLSKMTGVSRSQVIRAKRYLVDDGWLYADSGRLLINCDREVPEDVALRARDTTRKAMFRRLVATKD